MFPAAAFTPDWINTQRRQLGNCDPGILEKCVHALTLLGYLVQSGLPFIFKGGTSLLLHLPQQSGEEQLQQVAKQLFDVGVLFDVATDFDAVAKSYTAVSAQESEYRGNQHSREAALDDTWQACIALTATKPAILEKYPEAKLLHGGLDKMRGHLTTPAYVADIQARRTLAAKAAALAAHLRAGVPFDFGSMRYTGSAEQLNALRVATLNGTPLAWIDGVKGANAEAYYYWHRAIKVGS